IPLPEKYGGRSAARIGVALPLLRPATAPGKMAFQNRALLPRRRIEHMATATRPITAEPLSDVIGARIKGVDLSQDYGEDARRAIGDAFARYSVLCFSNQDISYEDQTRFASIFGKADDKKIGKEEKGHGQMRERGVMYITNIRENGKQIGSLPDGEMQFHS